MKKALIIQGGWKGHEPEACADVMAKELRDSGLEVQVSDTLDALLEPGLEDLDLIVPVWTMGDLGREQFAALKKAALAGVGIGGWHGGMGDAFRSNTEYQFIVGGQFICHPGGIIDYRVAITNHEDPITQGLSDFDMHSEQYYMHVDPSNDVLAETTFSGEHWDIGWVKGCVMPQVWKRPYGNARVFYSALGHVAADFDVPQVREITRRGLLWAAREIE